MNEINIEMVDVDKKEEGSKTTFSSTKFCYSAEELSAPTASCKESLFNWESKDGYKTVEAFGGIENIAKVLDTDLKNGLTTSKATDEERIGKYGSNKQEVRNPVSYLQLLWEGYHDMTLIALTVAGAISIVTGIIGEGIETGWLDGFVILLAVVIVLNVGAINDWQKDRQFLKLNAENNKRDVAVIRDGVEKTILIDDVVVGDIMIITGGNNVPVDALYVSGDNIKMDESKLTGESEQLRKDHEHPFIVSSSECFDGKMTCLVVAVGHNSVYGKMKDLITNDHTEQTPLQKKLDTLAGQLSILGGIAAGLTVIIMFITHIVEYANGDGTIDENGDPEWTISNWTSLIQFVIAGIAVLVVAIPEGLPLAVSIALAYSVKRMMTDYNLVRHLNACETMGGATTICSDKTGTLTKGQMTVMQSWILDMKEKDQTKCMNKYELLSKDERDNFIKAINELPAGLKELLIEDSILNNDAFIDVKDGKERGIGSSLDIALLNFCKDLGIDYKTVREKFPLLDNKVDETSPGIISCFPFHSNRKRSSVVLRLPNGKYRVYVKGAPDMLLRLSNKIVTKDMEMKELDGNFFENSDGSADGSGTRFLVMNKCIKPMSKTGLRVIAMGYKDYDTVQDWKEMVEYKSTDQKGVGNCPKVEEDLTLICLIGVQDPIRPEVPECVLKCQKAGIAVRMVTGDSLDTAKCIAKQCNIYNNSNGICVTGTVFREQVGGFVLPPHFDHECHCQDLSSDPAYKSGYRTAKYPTHYDYPSIVGHKDDLYCCNWSEEAINKRGGITKCTEECKQRGCRYQMSEKDRENKSAEQKYYVIKNQYVFDSYLHNLQVMARSAPTDKHLLVSGLMERGQVVAVTGDGTNDGPALAKSNVGFAMGISGTAIAKEACDIILMDDNFASIVAAVKWGRNVYENIRRFLSFQLSAAYSALGLTFISACVIKESPLTAVQILWFNIIMDTMAGTALGTEMPTESLLLRKPNSKTESIISPTIMRNIISQIIYQLVVIMFIVFRGQDILGVPIGTKLGPGSDPSIHLTVVFHMFTLMQLFNEVNCRKINSEWNIFGNVWSNKIFVGVIIITTGLQFLIVEVGGKALSVKSLNGTYHGICIIAGAFTWVVYQLVRFIPAKLFPQLGRSESGEYSFQNNFLLSQRSRRASSSIIMGRNGSANSRSDNGRKSSYGKIF